MRHMLGVVLAAAVLPATATAATIHVNTNWRSEVDTITYAAGPGETNDVKLSTFQQYARLDDPGALITSPDLPTGSLYCVGAVHTGLCTGGTYYTLVASLGDGNDTIDTSGYPMVYSNADGGPGDDQFSGGDASYAGGPGADDFRGPGSR